MAQYVYTLLSLAMSCSVRREISPCSCDVHPSSSNMIMLTCDGVDSFNRVFDALQNRFNPDLKIQLLVNRSQLEDMETKAFGDMNLRLKNLRLNFDNLKTVPESSFRNLTHLEFLSLAYNNLEEVPRHIFPHTPKLGTLDLGAQRIRRVSAGDFRLLPRIEHLLMFRNALTELDTGSLPNTLRTLHLSRNNLTTLNGTLRHMDVLRLVFLNDNRLTTLDNELPLHSTKLFNILAHNNLLTHLPPDFRTLTELRTLYMRNNRLRSLDGMLRHSRHLENFEGNQNLIEILAEDEFEDCEIMEMLDLGANRIRSVNGSLLPLKNLRSANFSGNLLTEFSLDEIRGLRRLRVLDLSKNQIERLSGKMVNNVEPDLFVIELRLQHNRLKTLDGAMMGMNRLVQLDLSHNLLSVLAPDDLIGLEELDVLDISYNLLQTLEETSKSFLPKLTKLNASNNNLTKLDKDFYGLPALCVVDLSHNRIASISPNLVDKTRCISHTVVTKMDIMLQDNPVLCQHDLDQLIQILNAQEARLKGLAHCLVRNEELPAAPVEASNTLIEPSLVHTIMQNLQKPIVHETPAVVQVFIPPSAVQTATAPNASETRPDETLFLSPPTASPIVNQLLFAAKQETTIDSIAETAAVEFTTILPTVTQMSNVIQPSVLPMAVLSDPAVAPAVERAATYAPVPSTTSEAMPLLIDLLLSNVIPTPEEHVEVLPILPVVQQLDVDAAAFDDIQPSDIVTLPDPLPMQPELHAASEPMPEATHVNEERSANTAIEEIAIVEHPPLTSPIEAIDDTTFENAHIAASIATVPSVDDLLEMPPPQAILTDDIQQT